MKAALIQFPGSNRDNDMIVALTKIYDTKPELIWHTDTNIPDTDLIVIPGGFSYGDYLRAGAIAARSPIMNAIHQHDEKGTPILGVCNGFQILTEAGLLPGSLMRNAGLNFVCREISLEVTNNSSIFSNAYQSRQIIRCPIAHHDGNYFAEENTLSQIENNGQVVFRYVENDNPNGSLNNIAGLTNKRGNILGMMPHPENLIEQFHGSLDGRGIFQSLFESRQVIAA